MGMLERPLHKIRRLGRAPTSCKGSTESLPDSRTAAKCLGEFPEGVYIYQCHCLHWLTLTETLEKLSPWPVILSKLQAWALSTCCNKCHGHFSPIQICTVYKSQLGLILVECFWSWSQVNLCWGIYSQEYHKYNSASTAVYLIFKWWHSPLF